MHGHHYQPVCKDDTAALQYKAKKEWGAKSCVPWSCYLLYSDAPPETSEIKGKETEKWKSSPSLWKSAPKRAHHLKWAPAIWSAVWPIITEAGLQQGDASSIYCISHTTKRERDRIFIQKCGPRIPGASFFFLSVSFLSWREWEMEIEQHVAWFCKCRHWQRLD